MRDMSKAVLNFIGYLFGMLILGFTSYQTWNLLYEVSGNQIVAGLGLVLFEGSMLYWWLFFLKEAEGLLQLALSLLVAIFGLVMVSGATALHLGAIGFNVLGADTPSRLITIAAIVNLVAKFMMPLLHPNIMKQIYKKALTGRVMAQTFGQFDNKVREIAIELADEVSETWTNEMRQEIVAWHVNRAQVALPAPQEERWLPANQTERQPLDVMVTEFAPQNQAAPMKKREGVAVVSQQPAAAASEPPIASAAEEGDVSEPDTPFGDGVDKR
ncbi:MAG TPA: hypothetical protein VLL52_13715 [Anaerolineae bacterium]|nr:hypothetical protein [Anaerolineae bacterium]